MIKFLLGVAVGTQIAQYVTPSVDSYIFAPVFDRVAKHVDYYRNGRRSERNR